MDKKLWLFIIGLTIFSLGLRAYRLTEPKGYYFDEVYHAVTAKAYADNNPAAYDPFAPAPKEGTAYDWLHPPLAKLIQAGSIKILGDVPIGWRLPSLIFGTAIIPLTFILAFILFGPVAAVFSATVVAFENLTFVMSRITMNDVFITSFSLTAFIFAALYARKKKFIYLLTTSVFLGLAVTSKWTGAYALAAVFGYLLFDDIKNKKLNIKLLVLLIIPFLMYLGSYGQFWLQGHTIGDFINLHKQIWWYQNRHDLEHSYGTTPLYCVPHGINTDKTWCPWVLDARGVYFSYEQYEQKAGYIYALGNPLIFWFGIIAVSYVLGKFLEERKKEYALILVGYFIFWLPWIFTPRLLFLYHYLPAIPFLSVALGVSLATIYKTKFKIVAILIVLIFIAAFFYFYPITSGWPIDPASIDKYMWLSTWR
jgi:dolichyl-phosphate-mannose-protein mannosyltransferase